MRKSLTTSYLSVVSAVIVTGLVVHAASAGIVVSPLKQEVNVKPGREAKFYISITNNPRSKRDTAQTVHLEVMDFQVTETGGLAFKPIGTAKHSAGRWIKLGQTDLTLNPGEGTRVECTVKPPHSALGEAYSAIMVTLGTKGKTGVGVTVGYRTASGVFVQIAGRSFPKRAKITRCEVIWPTPKAASSLPTLVATQPAEDPNEKAPPKAPKVVAVLQNTGRVRFKASGEMRVNDAQGRIMFRAPMKTKRSRVLPGDTREFYADLQKALPPGPYTVKVELDYESEWSKVRERKELTISADQAALLAALRPPVEAKDAASLAEAGTAKIELEPEELTEKIPAGGFRLLKVVARNGGADAVGCKAAVKAEPDATEGPSWITVMPEQFVLAAGRSKTLSVIARVPPEANGSQRGVLAIEYSGTDGTMHRGRIPVHVTVPTSN